MLFAAPAPVHLNRCYKEVFKRQSLFALRFAVVLIVLIHNVQCRVMYLAVFGQLMCKLFLDARIILGDPHAGDTFVNAVLQDLVGFLITDASEVSGRVLKSGLEPFFFHAVHALLFKDGHELVHIFAYELLVPVCRVQVIIGSFWLCAVAQIQFALS